MEMWYSICFVFLFLGSDLSDAKPSYTIVAPRILRPNSEYHVSLSVNNVTSDLKFNVEVAGPASDLKSNYIAENKTLRGNDIKIVQLKIGSWLPGNYKLTVKGSGAIDFQNATDLEFVAKSYSVLIQTDKAIYKPGQLVQFRAIIIKQSLQAAEIGSMNLYIKDAKNNRIKEWTRQLTKHGIISHDFQLSENPVLGDWTIVVEVDKDEHQKKFTVAEYVLPTFDVQLNLPKYAVFNKTKVLANVKATYTYGKPVTGSLVLKVKAPPSYDSSKDYQYQVIVKDFMGSTDVYVDLYEDLHKHNDGFPMQVFDFIAIVEESLTGRKYNRTSSITVYDYDFNVELVSPTSLKPGLINEIKLKVAYRDSTPIENNGSPVIVQNSHPSDESIAFNISVVPVNGIAIFNLTIPRENSTHVSISAYYKGQLFPLSLTPFNSESKHSLLVKLLDSRSSISVDSTVNLQVSATEPLNSFVYQVVSRGDIVRSELVQTISTHGPYQFSFNVQHNMAPHAKVIVHYLREDGELMADSISFDVDGLFRTPVTVESTVAKSEPGGAVGINVRTNPNALVCILGVDQSLLLLKSGNDITREMVINEIESYENPPEKYSSFRRGFGFGQSDTVKQVFYSNGLVYLTNGYTYEPLYLQHYRSISFDQPENLKTGILTDDVLDDEFSVQDRFSGKDLLHFASTKKVTIRRKFPETWLWENRTANSNGLANFKSTAPDTITSWIISAFAMDQFTGLGIAQSPAKMTVFRSFFIKMNLPYSIVRGETTAIQVVVFNYMDKPIKAEVILFNKEKEFSFTTASNEIDDQDEVEKKSKIVHVDAQNGATVTFLITPKTVGHIEFHVQATSEMGSNFYSDAVKRKLLVKPEGQTQYFNKAFLLDFRDKSNQKIKEKVHIKIPSNAIVGSKGLKVSAIGDVLGTSLNNLDDLLRMPYGCGEQNMLNFVPNIVVLDYLHESFSLTKKIESKALKHIESGYQREMTYRRDDGSFSAFGSSDKFGSTWLTAFVLKSFYQAQKRIMIEENVLQSARNFLLRQLRDDGSFEERGEVHHKSMQGGSAGNNATLTAYVFIALLQDANFRLRYEKESIKIEKYLIDRIAKTNNSYELSLITYALVSAKSNLKWMARDKLLLKASSDNDYMWWTDVPKVDTSNKESYAYFLPQSTDVETSSYALLSLMRDGNVTMGMPIMRWLISKQNSNGGFSSTQDTVIALQALAQLASKVASGTIMIDTQFTLSGVSTPVKFNINSDNSRTLQAFEIDDIESGQLSEFIDIEATGFGVAVVQVSWRFNLAVASEEPSFYLNPLIHKSSTENFMRLNVCTRYQKAGKATNMAVMEVEMPSGYVADLESLPEIKSQSSVIKRIDTDNGDTNVIIYFDRITNETICITVPAYRVHKVANVKQVPVTVYDYYKRDELSRVMYAPRVARSCDICDGTDCDCKRKLPTNSNVIAPNAGSLATMSMFVLLASLFTFLIN